MGFRRGNFLFQDMRLDFDFRFFSVTGGKKQKVSVSGGMNPMWMISFAFSSEICDAIIIISHRTIVGIFGWRGDLRAPKRAIGTSVL